MDTSKLYNNPDYSDVDVKLSDGRLIDWYKVVLCESLETDHFRKLYGPGTPFAENSNHEIEPTEDSPDAIEALIRFIYRGSLQNQSSPILVQPTWRSRLDLRVTAERYGVQPLNKSQNALFRSAVKAVSNTEEIFKIIRTLQTEMSHDASLISLAEILRKDCTPKTTATVFGTGAFANDTPGRASGLFGQAAAKKPERTFFGKPSVPRSAFTDAPSASTNPPATQVS